MPTRKRQTPAGSIIPVTPVSGEVLSRESRVKLTLERLFSDLNPNTVRAYQKAWDLLAEHLKVGSRAEAAMVVVSMEAGAANEMALGWIAAMKRDEFSASTISTRLGALKGIVKRFRIVGLVPWSIEIKGPGVNAYGDTSGPETVALHNVVEQLRLRSDEKGIRDLAIIHALYSTGLRRGELAALTLKDLDLEKNRVWIMGKGRDDSEWITFREKTKEALERWLAVRPGQSDYVFVALDPCYHGKPLSGHGIWDITTSYGIGRPHGLRHSGITMVLKKTNGNIRIAQKFSRHRDPKTLIKYDDNRRDVAGEASGMLEEDL